MKIVPDALGRLSGRSLLKLKKASPTLLVVAGTTGLVATAVMAAKATRKIDPILDEHAKARVEIDALELAQKDEQRALIDLYTRTGLKLGKLYGPTIFVGACSAVSVLGGHKILRTRQAATLAAYSGLYEQFSSYRERVKKTLGEDVEKGIYEGARGEWVEDPNHPGEYKMAPKFDGEDEAYRPWFDEMNPNWTPDAQANYLFLKGVQSHMNSMLRHRGHVLLSDVYDALHIPRPKGSSVVGWVYGSDEDNYVDFGFMTSVDPNSIAFCNGAERTVRLNFNYDGPIWDRL